MTIIVTWELSTRLSLGVVWGITVDMQSNAVVLCLYVFNNKYKYILLPFHAAIALPKQCTMSAGGGLLPNAEYRMMRP